MAEEIISIASGYVRMRWHFTRTLLTHVNDRLFFVIFFIFLLNRIQRIEMIKNIMFNRRLMFIFDYVPHILNKSQCTEPKIWEKHFLVTSVMSTKSK